MFEFTVSSNQNSLMIDNLYTNLKSVIDSLNGIIVKQKSLKTCNVCFAVDDKHEQYIKAVLLDFVSDEIISEYKFEYLANNIHITIKNPVALNLFMRALVVFDRQTDKDIIKKNLILENKLNIDSFYNFRLEQLKNRWQDIACVVNESLPIMLQNKSVADITRYFVDNTYKEINEMHVYLGEKNIKIGVDDSISDLEFDTTNDYVSDILTELISLSPKKIIVHGKLNNHRELQQALTEVFSDSVFILK